MSSEDILAWFQQAANDVFRVAEMGAYDGLELVSSQYLHLPPDSTEPFCLWAALRFQQPPGPGVFVLHGTSNLSSDPPKRSGIPQQGKVLLSGNQKDG